MRGFQSIRSSSYSRVDTCERISINSKWQLLKSGHLWKDFYQFEVTVTQGWTIVRGFLSIRRDSYSREDNSERISINSKRAVTQGWTVVRGFLSIRSDSYSRVDTCERISINSKWQLLKGWSLVRVFLSIRSEQLLKGWPLVRGFLSIRSDSYSRVATCERISINSKWQLLKGGQLWVDFYQFEVTVTQGWTLVRGFLSIRSGSYWKVDTCERISINSKWQLLKVWTTCERISINSKWQLLKG